MEFCSTGMKSIFERWLCLLPQKACYRTCFPGPIKSPSIKNHSVYFPASCIQVPFLLEGVISYFPSRKPSLQEVEEHTGNYLMLTPNLLDWNPHTEVYKDQEESMMNYRGEIKERDADDMVIAAVGTADETTIEGRLMSQYEPDHQHRVSKVSTSNIVTVILSDLAQRWNIPIKLAKRTVRATTQLCKRSREPVSLNWRFKSNWRNRRFKPNWKWRPTKCTKWRS